MVCCGQIMILSNPTSVRIIHLWLSRIRKDKLQEKKDRTERKACPVFSWSCFGRMAANRGHTLTFCIRFSEIFFQFSPQILCNLYRTFGKIWQNRCKRVHLFVTLSHFAYVSCQLLAKSGAKRMHKSIVSNKIERSNSSAGSSGGSGIRISSCCAPSRGFSV